MQALLDMASSPQYLAPSAHNNEDIDLDIDPAITAMANGSCSSIPPSTVSYASPDPNSYSEVSHIPPFGNSPVVTERLLTPDSSAASPQLQQRSCRQSPFEHHQYTEDSAAQQPTPPHAASMYPYPEYMNGNQATSSMPMPSTVAESSHDLLPFLQPHHHPSPGHEDAHPAPQTNPYYGSYTVSGSHEPDQYYLPTTCDMGPLGLLRQDVSGGSYTQRPLAPMSHHSPMFSNHPQSPYRLPRLSPTTPSRHYAVPRARRDRPRKSSVRNSISRRDSFTPSEHGSYMHSVEDGGIMNQVEDDDPYEEVTLEEKTPANLRRLWDIRRKWLGKKGNGMWEDIMNEYHCEENLPENKKTQVKAGLQMKIHRMLLKYGKWPRRDESALRRAWVRWEEVRYTEILRLFEEEMGERKKSYDWKSQHVEAQLVKMGLEELERGRDSKARKRKQVSALHTPRAGGPLPPRPAALQQQQQQQQQQPQHRLPGMYDPAPYGHHYAPQPQHYGQQPRTASYDSAFAEQIGAQPPVLSDEQNTRLANEILERNPFADGGDNDDDDNDVDVKMELMSDYASSDQHHQAAARSRAASLIPGLNHTHHQQQHHGLPGTPTPPDANAQRNAAVARQACGEILKQYGPDVGV